MRSLELMMEILVLRLFFDEHNIFIDNIELRGLMLLVTITTDNPIDARISTPKMSALGMTS